MISHHPSLAALCYIQYGIYAGTPVAWEWGSYSHLWEQEMHGRHKEHVMIPSMRGILLQWHPHISITNWILTLFVQNFSEKTWKYICILYYFSTPRRHSYSKYLLMVHIFIACSTPWRLSMPCQIKRSRSISNHVFDLIINYLGLCKHNRWVPLSHDLILTIAMSKVAHTKDFEPQNAHYIGKVWDDKCDYFVENWWCDDKTVLYSWEWRCLISSWTLTVQGQDHCKL